jgi:hypothetical protein
MPRTERCYPPSRKGHRSGESHGFRRTNLVEGNKSMSSATHTRFNNLSDSHLRKIKSSNRNHIDESFLDLELWVSFFSVTVSSLNKRFQ